MSSVRLQERCLFFTVLTMRKGVLLIIGLLLLMLVPVSGVSSMLFNIISALTAKNPVRTFLFLDHNESMCQT